MAGRFASSFSQWIIANRWLVIALNIAIVVIAGLGLPPKFSTDYRMFFSDGNQLLKNFEALERTYTKNDNIHYLFEAKNGDVFDPDVLAAIGEFTEEGWKLPYAMRVDSITNFQDTQVNGDEVDVKDLVENPTEISAANAATAKSRAMQEPRLINRLVSDTAKVTGVNITLQLPDPVPKANTPVRLTPKEFEARAPADRPERMAEPVLLTPAELAARDKHFRDAGGIVTAEARELMARLWPKHADAVDMRLVGITPFNQSFTEASQKDMGTLFPIAFLIMFVLLLLLLRNLFAALITFCLVIMFSIITGLGGAAWIGIPLSPPASASIMIILTLAIAHSVHLFIAILYGMRRGEDRITAIQESLRINLFPVFLTSVTTMIGFLCLNTSDAPPFADLGNIVAIGVVASFIFGVTLLPAVASLLPLHLVDFGRKTSKDPSKRRDDLMDKFSSFVVRRRGILLIIMILIVTPLIALVPSNNLDDVFMKYFAKSMQIRQDAEFVLDNYTGFDGLVYSLEAGDEQYDIANPEFLAKVDAFADFWRQDPDTKYVISFTDTMKKLHQDFVGNGDKQLYQLPESREMGVDLLFLYESSLPQGLDLNNEINQNKSSIRFTVVFGRISSKGVAQKAEIGKAWMQANMPEYIQPANGTSMMFADISSRNIKSMVIGSVGALILISFILILALRSIKVGLISLIPNLVPAGMAFGIWALTGQEVTVALSVVLGMTLGIVVDDTVHFLNAYLRAKREQGKDANDAVKYAFSHVGKALWSTSIILIFGFGVLAFSAFSPNADMGLLTAITIGMAIFADFLLLPPMLMYLDRGKKNGKSSTTTQPVSAG